jgi:sodium transport system permease protein
MIDEGEWELLIVFPEDFSSALGDDGTVVNLYFNQNEADSVTTYSLFKDILDAYLVSETYLYYHASNVFGIVVDSTTVDVASQTAAMIALILPMLVIMFLFSGAMTIGPESIAGEKERGTIATLLVTPVKRREIAAGKILSLSVLSLLSAISSFIGILASLPRLFDYANLTIEYGVTDYLMILILLFSTVFVIVGLIAIISAFARNLKEASTMIIPFYLVTIIVGVSTMFTEGASQNPLSYLLPIYNTVQTLTAIILYDPSAVTFLAITVVANAVYAFVFLVALDHMFESERIMFSK